MRGISAMVLFLFIPLLSKPSIPAKNDSQIAPMSSSSNSSVAPPPSKVDEGWGDAADQGWDDFGVEDIGGNTAAAVTSAASANPGAESGWNDFDEDDAWEDFGDMSSQPGRSSSRLT